jgi:hypothetical protein
MNQLKSILVIVLSVLIFGTVAENVRNEVGDDLQDSVTNQGFAGSDDVFFGLYLACIFGLILVVAFAPVRN